MADKRKAPRELWASKPAEGDFTAAQNYLTLLMAADSARRVVNALRATEPVHRRARDILRASRLPLLPADDADVASDLKKIKRHEQLSPVLLVRGDWANRNRPLEIADGYHRICASFHVGQDAEVPCCIVEPSTV